jgi:hypothetical protein
MLVAYCQTDKLEYLVGAAIVGCLGILTKLPGIIVGLPAIYAIYAILGRRALYRQKLISLVVAGFSVLLVVSAYYLWARHLSVTYPPYHFAGAHKFISLTKIGDWMVNYYFLPDLFEQLFGWLWTWPVVILVVIGLLLFPRKGEQGGPGIQAAPWFWHWFGAALVIDYLIEAQHLVEDPNNMYLYVPFAAAMAGNAVLTVARLVWRERFHARKVIATAAIMVIVGLVGRQQIKPLYEPYYAASYHLGVIVNRIADPNDLIVSVGLNPCTIYYSQLRGWLFPPTEIWHTGFGWDYAEHDIEALKSLWKHGAKWLVISNTNDEYRNANDLKNGRGGTLWPYIASNFALYHEGEDGMIFQLPPYPHRRG